MNQMTDTDRFIALRDELHHLRVEMRSMTGDTGMTMTERAEVAKLKDAAAMHAIELKAIAGQVAELRKLLSTKWGEDQVHAKSMKVMQVISEATADIVMKETDELRAETKTAIEDASISWRRESAKSAAAAEGNITAATAFIRRSLHSFAS